MSYLPYLALVENIIAISSQFIAIGLWIEILHANFVCRQRLRCEIADSMLLFLVCHTLFSISDLPYRIYAIVQWQKLTEHPYLAFWVNILDGNYFATAPCFLLFLTIDRLLVLKLSYAASQTARKILLYSTVALVIFLVAGSTVIFLVELPLDLEYAKKCTAISCIVVKFKGLPQLVSRITFDTLSLCCSSLFFYLLPETGKSKQNNRVVKFSIFCEVLLNIIPGYVNLAFNSITGKNASSYVGEYTKMFFMIETACCAVYYSCVFLKRKRPVKILPTAHFRSSSDNTKSYIAFKRSCA
ncbi:hypothetical protein DdX_12904 [Ditylenchus destructor]|uniref:Uncharacterized protein n=1 Tax=Ditylenchus destructor TaxID=166010 RepID=A0AAD4R3A1_9BILA|nr:hypothetical protein DdX_12904 [Ditylenchus destructor]